MQVAHDNSQATDDNNSLAHLRMDRYTNGAFSQILETVMKLQNQEEIADISLFEVEVSESELEVYQQCMEYVLSHLDPKRIEEEFGAYPDEIAGMLGHRFVLLW